MGISLLEITESLNKLLDRDIIVVREQVTLGRLTRVVDKRVGICVVASGARDNIAGKDASVRAIGACHTN